MSTLEDLKKERDNHTTKIFMLGLYIAFIFAVPAFLGVLVGLRLDAAYQTGRKITVAILAVTFIFSWFLIIMRYLQLQKKLAEISRAIKKESQNRLQEKIS